MYPPIIHEPSHLFTVSRKQSGQEKIQSDKMIQIPLTQGKYALIDDCDSHLLNWKWYYGRTGYARRSLRISKGKQLTISLHHAIMGLPLFRKEIDHINGIRLDCRRSNLRCVTRRQNQQNKNIHRNHETSSEYVGVTWNKRLRNWIAQICVGNNRKHLGVFRTAKEASEAYRQACFNCEPNAR